MLWSATLKIGGLTKLGLFFPVVSFIHVFNQTSMEQLYCDKGLLAEQTNTYCIFTCSTAVEFSSHRNVASPSFGMNADVPSQDRWVDHLPNNTVPVSVTLEILFIA